ncbi:MAG: N-acetylneuraminate synthase [Candidatus Brocadiia bacterium]|nr:MAG: N-acetylneuraminate synthase [Candidatus Brocadiia bacterium]
MVETTWDKIVDPAHTFIIAEAGVNHNGNLELAKQLIDIAVNAGADAVKFQTFRAEKVVTPDTPKADYQLQTTEESESQFDMLRKLELSYEQHRELMSYCRKQEIIFMSTPFDRESADFLYELSVPVFKIGSGEITNLPFLEYVSRKGKPVILSTGMSYLSEVDEAVRVIRSFGCKQLVLLHCVSNYPADPMDVNLRTLQTMATAFDLPVGYSDHTQGIEVSIAAVALGACVIEKHFTMDCTLSGPDHRASLEPKELMALVKCIRTVESALGHGRKEPSASEANIACIARRSLVAAKNIQAGAMLTEDVIDIKRPGTGLKPTMFKYIIGRRAKENIAVGSIIDLGMLL